MSLPESLERAATELTALADQIRPANGDPDRLLEELKPGQAGEVLKWVLVDEPDAGAELIEAWEETEAGQQALLGISEDGFAKAGRKILRRAHHRLRSRGVEVPESASVSAKPSRRVVAREDGFEAACLSAPDFRGARVGYLADRHPSGGARLFEIRFDEARGILEFKVYNAGRSKVRGFLRSLSSAQAHRLFDVPRDALRSLVRRASAAQPVDRPLPNAFVEWRGRLFGDDVDGLPTPGGLARAGLEKETAAKVTGEPLDQVAALVGDGEAGPWPPATTWVAEKMDEGRERTKGLEGDALEHEIEALSDEFARSLVAESDDALIARHLEELAWVHWQMEREASAASLLAVADALPGDPSASERLAKARIESLLAPYFGELRAAAESGDAGDAEGASA